MVRMTQEFLSAVGSVVVEFALLEQQLDAAAWSVLVGTRLEDQAAGRLITAGLSSRKTLELFAALVRHRFVDRVDSDLTLLCKQVVQAEEKRNLVVHSTWALAEDAQFMRIKTTRTGDLTFCKMTAADLRAIAAEVHSAAEAVINFHLSLLQPGHQQVTL